jgi:hypothetical protein
VLVGLLVLDLELSGNAPDPDLAWRDQAHVQRARQLRYRNFDSAIPKIQTVGVSLAAVSNRGHFPAFQSVYRRIFFRNKSSMP